MDEIKSFIEEGKLKTIIDREYSLGQIVAAYAYVEQFHKIGNVVVAIYEVALIGKYTTPLNEVVYLPGFFSLGRINVLVTKASNVKCWGNIDSKTTIFMQKCRIRAVNGNFGETDHLISI